MFLQTEPNSLITFKNNTPFRVNITVGSMVRPLDPIDPWKSLSVPNIYSDTEIYYLSYDIPLMLSSNNYDLLNIRPEGISSHFQIDGSNKDQTVIINMPAAFDINNSYAVITNNSRSGGIYLSENQTSRLTCVHEHHKNNINQNETEVFLIIPGKNKTLYVSGPVNITLPSLNYHPAYVYFFSYDGSTVTFTDSRPLHRLGETSWAKTINGASGPMMLLTADGEIHLFASTNKGIIRNAYDSAGNVKETVQNGKEFFLTHASKTKDGFFIAGYEKLANGNYQPIARIQSNDGSTRYALKRSEKYATASFNTAVGKDNNSWLLAGAGTKANTYGNTANARMVRIEKDEFTDMWEINPDVKCADVKSAIYDKTRDCWFVTGENLEYDSMKNKIEGSYIAQIGNDGKIQNINHSFKDMLFNKILIDTNGICYLAGEEKRGSETYAVLVKYNVKDGSFKRIFTQTLSHSYYHDAILDTANNQIVLGGVMKASDETGRRGVPFVEVVNIQTENLMFREELSNIEKGIALVTALALAPDYGFVLALCGIDNATGYYREPYMIVRVNSQGKYIKEIRK